MSDFRVAIGRIKHETNSFCQKHTELSVFQAFSTGIDVGEDLLDRPERHDEVRGFIDVLGSDGDVEIAPLLSTTAPPSGLVSVEAIRFIAQTLRDQLRQAGRLDGICFALHGAMSGEEIFDLDGYFLQVIRDEVGLDIPIVCSLDCHAVVTRQMVELSDALTAYRTHPHVDFVETGRRAASILLGKLTGKTKPLMRCKKMPMLFSDNGMGSGPLKTLLDEIVRWDKTPGVIACSVCPCYEFQDVPEQGWAAIAVTDNDEQLAVDLTKRIAQRAWDVREELLPKAMLGPEESIRKAAATPGCPVVITDSADNVGGGSSGDTPALLRSLLDLRHEVDGLILAHIVDPEAVAIVKAANISDEVSLKVGGKCNPEFGGPVLVKGKVICVTEGPITDDGKFGSDPMIDTGTIVCLAVDNIRLVLTEQIVNGPQPSLFRKVGIEPFDAKIVTLKTGIGWKTTYAHVAKAVILADCPGPASNNLSNFHFKHVPRPIFPLDKDFEWNCD